MPLMKSDEIDALKADMAKARKKDIAFGVCLGKKPENTVMYLDKIKAPEVIERRAKKAGETNFVACGQVSLKSKKCILTLMGDALPGMSKRLRKFFSGTVGMKLTVVVLDPTGAELEADYDEDDAPEENREANAEAADDPLKLQWAKVEEKLAPVVTAFADSGDERVPAIAKAWAGAQVVASKGDYKSALGAASKVQKIVVAAKSEETGKKQAEDPNFKKWQAVEKPMQALFQKAMANKPPEGTKLEAAWVMATEKADGKDYASAIKIAGRLRPRLEEAAAGDSGTAQEDVDAFQKSHVLWVNTRKTMLSEVQKLEAEIAKVCSSIPELKPYADRKGVLSARLEVFDEDLQDILDQITNTPEGDARTKLKAEARGKIAHYQTALADDFFKDVDTNNGFTKVNVAGVAMKSLQAIEKVLAA